MEFVQPLRSAVSKITHACLIYPTVIPRGRFLDRWNLNDVLLIVAYIGTNVVCVILPLSGIQQVVLRSGTLSIINLSFCFAGPYLGFLADILAVSVKSCRRLHATVGTLGVFLAVVHASSAAAANKALDLHERKDLFALVVGQLVFEHEEVLTDLAVHSMHLCPGSPFGTARHDVRSFFAHPPGPGFCLGVRALAACLFFETVPRPVFLRRWCFVSDALHLLACPCSISQQVRAF